MKQGNCWAKQMQAAFIWLKREKAKRVRRIKAVDAARNIFHCLIFTFHTTKLTNQILNFKFHTMKSRKEQRDEEYGVWFNDFS